MKRSTRIIPFAAAAAAAALACSVGAYAYFTPCAYVSLDVNPSIEYTLNRFDRVLTVSGINDDGEQIIREIELEQLVNRQIDEAIERTVRQIEASGFFGDDLSGEIVIAASAQELRQAETIIQLLSDAAEEAVDGEDIIVEAFPVSSRTVEEAHALGVSPGKLHLVEKLAESAPDPGTIDREDWLDQPVQAIMKEIKANRTEQKANDKAEKEEAKAESQQQKADDKAEKEEAKAESQQQKADDKAEKEEAKAESQQQKANDKAEKEEAKALRKADAA